MFVSRVVGVTTLHKWDLYISPMSGHWIREVGREGHGLCRRSNFAVYWPQLISQRTLSLAPLDGNLEHSALYGPIRR